MKVNPDLQNTIDEIWEKAKEIVAMMNQMKCTEEAEIKELRRILGWLDVEMRRGNFKTMEMRRNDEAIQTKKIRCQ